MVAYQDVGLVAANGLVPGDRLRDWNSVPRGSSPTTDAMCVFPNLLHRDFTGVISPGWRFEASLR